MNAAAFWAPLGLAAGMALAVATAPSAEPLKACCRGGSHAEAKPDADAGLPIGAPLAQAPAIAVGDLSPPPTAIAPAPANSGSFRIGVVIYSFENGKRSKAMAKALADKSVQTAGTDFAAAVKGGDSDSDSDYGTFSAHSFDNEVEAAIVAIPVGQVGGPIETPRGYWVVKRLK